MLKQRNSVNHPAVMSQRAQYHSYPQDSDKVPSNVLALPLCLPKIQQHSQFKQENANSGLNALLEMRRIVGSFDTKTPFPGFNLSHVHD